MKKIELFYTKYNALIMLVLFTLIVMNMCSVSSSIKKLSKSTAKHDTILAKTVTAEEVNSIIKIEGLRISKRNLYDQNSIIRTTIRPDDRMNQYDEEIKTLTKGK